MKHWIRQRLNWLESHWVVPAFAGGLLGGLSLFFFASAINTMAGWLYVISGVAWVLLAIAAILPPRSLGQLQVRRRPIAPVSAGDRLTVELELDNPLPKPKTLLQVRDVIPAKLGDPVEMAIESIPEGGTHHWVYYQMAPKRGVYHWHEVQLRTAAPLGLFWARRHRHTPAKAIVYPTVLPLRRCPLIDGMGQEQSPQFQSRDRRTRKSNQGLTRALRPYRWGDPIRLVHWRTSARYGELRVRELETYTGGLEAIICIDNTVAWDSENFEQAAIAAASLYFYASRRQLNAQLWSAKTGLIRGHRVVLEALADLDAGGSDPIEPPPSQPLIWLTQNRDRLSTLPSGSRWVLWSPPNAEAEGDGIRSSGVGVTIDPDKSLQAQLQRSLAARI